MSVYASVAIPTYKRSDFVLDALQSVTKQQTGFAYEVLVLDNGCDPALQTEVERIDQSAKIPVHYITVPEIGLHQGRHAGAREAQGEIVVYVDDDVIVPSDWLEALLKPYADPRVACVGGKTVPKWEVEPPAWLQQFGGNGSGYLSLLDLGDKTLELAWPEGVYGCNMSVRRSVLYAVGGFNPDAIGDRRQIWLRGDGETGLHKKIYDAGYKVIYEPQAWLYHRIPASRLTPEYFCWRSFIQGISDSYTHVRTYHLSSVRLVRHAGRCMLRTGRCYLSSRRHPESWVRLRAQAWYWYGRGSHQLRVAISPRLRHHVLQECYL